VICKFYLNTLAEIYGSIDADETKNCLVEQFESEIRNIKATVERLVARGSGLSEEIKESERSDLNSQSDDSLSEPSPRLSPR
jgi:hypothetical protein